MADLTLDPALDGTTQNFSTDQMDLGTLGDGSVPTQDWFQSLINSNAAQAAAAAGVTAILGGQKQVVNSNGTVQAVPSSQQGGPVGSQSTVVPWFKKVPVIGWVIAGAVLVAGIVVIAFSGEPKRARA